MGQSDSKRKTGRDSYFFAVGLLTNNNGGIIINVYSITAEKRLLP